MQEPFIKVGELARRTAVSVRTLHHYHEIGLLEPAVGGGGEHRLYGRKELQRLQHIRVLLQLGLSLEETRSTLDDPEFDAASLLERQLARVEDQIELATRLRSRLLAVAEALRRTESPSSGDLLDTLEAMKDMERYYTKDQLDYLEKRAAEVGQERIQEVQEEWKRLFGEFRAALERGDAPESETARELARRAQALIEEFTGGHAGVRESLRGMVAAQPDEMAERWGVEPEVARYMGRASGALADD